MEHITWKLAGWMGALSLMSILNGCGGDLPSPDQNNTKPIADAQSITIDEDTTQAIVLSGSDIDGDTLTYTVTRTPGKGTLSGTLPDLTYTPSLNYHGQDSFKFKINDGTVDSLEATISLTVNSVNDVPVSDAQSITTDEDTAQAIVLSGSDVDGDTLAYTVTQAPGKGTLSGTAPNLTYTPSPNYHGVDTFTFLVNDGTADSPETTVSLTVNPVNDAPTADAGLDQDNTTLGSTVTLDGSGSSDIDADTLSYEWNITSKPIGSVAILSDTTIVNPTFTADRGGTYTIELIVNDGKIDSVPDSVKVVVCINSVIYHGLIYCEVTSPHTGRVWLDRNMGASRICTSMDDTQCYGNYYQWGRKTDDHEKSDSNIVSIQASDINTSGTDFVYSYTDWTSVDANGTIRSTNWLSPNGEYACPVGYAVPALDELKAETIDQNVSNSLEAFDTFLKLPAAGLRHEDDGHLERQDGHSDLWSSTITGLGVTVGYLDINDSDAIINYTSPAYGQSVRCIKPPEWIINDNFDNAVVGSLPSGWTIKYNGTGDANQKVVDALYFSPSHSFQLEGKSSWAANIYQTPSSIPILVTIESNIYIDRVVSGHSGWLALYNKDTGTWGTQVGGLQFKDGKFYAYYAGGNSYEISTFVPRQWYHVKIAYARGSKTYQIYIDGVLVSGTYGGVTYSTFPMHPTTDPTEIMLTAGNGGTVKVFYDDVKLY